MSLTDDRKAIQADNLQKAVEFASLYARTFPIELLRLWHQTIVERTLPPTATHAELAADNALRGFVVGIIRQVQLGQTGRVDKSCSEIVNGIVSQSPPTAPQQAEPQRPPRRPRQSRQT